MGSMRKPGSGRKPSKPDYDPSTVLQKQMDNAVALYGDVNHPSLQTIADELDLNPIKVRKLLITADVYKSDVAIRFYEFSIIIGVLACPTRTPSPKQ